MTTAWKRLLGPIKPLLLPVWNGGHRLAWRVGDILDALGHRRWERCACCGRSGPILRRRWIIRPELERRWGLTPVLADSLARKETDACLWCSAPRRCRRMAEVVLSVFPAGEKVECLRQWASTPSARCLSIAEINEVTGIHHALRDHPSVAYSEFTEGVIPGETADGIRCEDLTALTYPDASFDLVLHSETLEHVPDLGRAIGELWRVLKPGGSTVFTAPVLPNISTTFSRARPGFDGAVAILVEPTIRHPGGDWGYLVFHELGTDLPDLFRQTGFDVEVHFGPVRDDDLAQVYVARKPG